MILSFKQLKRTGKLSKVSAAVSQPSVYAGP